MLLKDLFKRFKIESENDKRRVAYVLAWFSCLDNDSDDEDNNEVITEDDIGYYDLEELEQLSVSQYDLECGAYHNGIWFSCESVIRALTSFQKDFGE